MNHPTLRTLARLLAPWRAIRRLELRNKLLSNALANPTLTGMTIHRDNATLGAAGPGPQIIAGMFLGLLQDNPKAVNYLELTFRSSEGNILVTVHRPGGATPHNLRVMAEQEAREAKREAEQLRAQLLMLQRLSGLVRSSRLRNCPTHGQQPHNVWRCSECLRELRQEAEQLRSDLATAREAVRRLVRWNLEAYDSEVVRGVYLWATLNAMTGPLPSLPEWLARREQVEGEGRSQ
jgi:hypothetical protein